jgi:hypothetical protein
MMLTVRVRHLTIDTMAMQALGLTLMSWCGITGNAWARLDGRKGLQERCTLQTRAEIPSPAH